MMMVVMMVLMLVFVMIVTHDCWVLICVYSAQEQVDTEISE